MFFPKVQLRKGYGIPDLKVDIAAQYMKAGVKSVGTVFLMTDAQVADEKFLVLINDLLASGEIPDLFAEDDVETIIAGEAWEGATIADVQNDGELARPHV